jgi:hypothetical protein
MAFSRKDTRIEHVNRIHKKGKSQSIRRLERLNARTHDVNRIHKKIKSYSCELCDYTSCTKSELKGHSVRRHSRKKSYRHDLDALMKEAQKDEMIVSIEKIMIYE